MNLEQLQKYGEVKTYKRGEFICLEHEKANTAFLLIRGNAEVRLGSFKDRTKQVALLYPGAIFGEMSLLENRPRTASVVAVSEQVLVAIIEKRNFIQILGNDADVAFNLLTIMIERVENSLNRMRDINIPYLAEFQHNKFYPQIKALTKEQFIMIVQNDSEHAMRIMKFLSHSLAEIDIQLSEKGFI